MGAELERNKRVAEAFLAALSRGDPETANKFYADDFTSWTMGTLPWSGTRKRKDAVELMGGLFSAFPDGLKFTVKGMTAEDDRVAVEAEGYGRHVSGRIYNNHYVFLLTFRDGKLVYLKEFFDSVHAKEVLFP